MKIKKINFRKLSLTKINLEKLRFEKKPQIDLDSTESKHPGIAGLFESMLRRFKVFIHLVTLLPMYVVASLCIGISFFPAVQAFKLISYLTSTLPSWVQALGYGVSLGLGYFMYGFTLLFVTGFFNWILRANIKAWRGPYYSLQSVRWYIHNGLTYIVRFTFLEFVTPTPFNLLFYKMMGMKIGRGTQINTVNISDPSLIEMGEKVTIGGSVTIVAHYGVAGFLILAPVKIGDGATIGLRAIIMGDVEVGAGAKVLPNSVVMPKTRILAGETWGGVPAQKIDLIKVA